MQLLHLGLGRHLGRFPVGLASLPLHSSVGHSGYVAELK